MPTTSLLLLPGVWDDSIEPFSDAGINAILITVGNFIQWQPPTHMYYGSDSIYTPITATQTVMDWVTDQADSLRIYIYENWPEMSTFPLTDTQFQAYHDETLGDFHDWWLTYQDSLLSSRPNDQIRMIPVGPIISKLLTQTPLEDIPITALYEDGDPHGRPTIYFLASLITYMSMYETPAPLSFPPDTTIHTLVHMHYETVVNFIWNELLAFNDDAGRSRVFFDNPSATHILLEASEIILYPNPTNDVLVIDGLTSNFHIDILDLNGNLHQNFNSSQRIQIDISTLPAGLYFIRIENMQDGSFYLEKILKQ